MSTSQPSTSTATDRALEELREYHRESFVRDVAGVQPYDILNLLENTPMDLFEDVIRLGMQCAFVNRTNIKEKVMPLITQKQSLVNFINTHCSLNKDINYRVLSLIGFLNLAAGFEENIGAQPVIKARYSSLNVFNWSESAMSESKKKAIKDFVSKTNKEQFDVAVDALKRVYTRTMIKAASGKMKVFDLTDKEAELTLGHFLKMKIVDVKARGDGFLTAERSAP